MFAKYPCLLFAFRPRPSFRLPASFVLAGLSAFTLAGCQPANASPDPSQPGFTWLFIFLTFALAAAAVFWVVSSRFSQLNSTIQTQSRERSKIETDLRQLQADHRTLFEKTPLSIIVCQQQTGQLLSVNQRAAATFGIDPAQLDKRQVSEFFARPRDLLELIRQVNQQEDPQGLQYEMISASGESFWAEISASPILVENTPAILISLLDLSANKELEKRIENLVMTDNLTGLLNRHYFFHEGHEEIKRVHRYPHPLSLIVLDIDHLKQVNDLYGHMAGDSVLKEFALHLLSNLRDVDRVGRLGGDEFAILMSSTDIDKATLVAQRLCKKIAAVPIFTAGQSISITVSIGVSHFYLPRQNLDDLIINADKALERAKQSGCNQVVIAAADLPQP